jgi:micrococcal nuclease
MVSVIWQGSRNVNLEMIKQGMAEAYPEYLRPPYRAQFIEAEKEARAKRLGIWSLRNDYERPSEFRKRMRVRGDF